MPKPDKNYNTEPRIADVKHLQELNQLLNEAGVDKSDICLIGSCSLAVWGIRQNRDIDFIATKKARQKFISYAKGSKNCKISKDGKIYFGEDIELVRPDRLEIIGVTDQKLFENTRYHSLINGYSVLKPELALSRKYTDQRQKDLQDIELIEDSGIIEAEFWDWDLVQAVPPWEHPKGTDLKKQFLKSLKSSGLKLTMEKGGHYIYSQLIPDRYTYRYEEYKTYLDKKRKLKPPIVNELEFAYPLLKLINRQYIKGEFSRYDVFLPVVDSISYGHSEINEDVIINTNGRMVSGVESIINKLELIRDDDTNNAHEEKIEINGIVDETPTQLTLSDVTEQYDNSVVKSVKEKKYEIFEDIGLIFYAILWPGSKQFHDEIEETVKEEAKVIASENHEIGNDLGEFVREVYSTDNRAQDFRIEKKIHELSKYPPNIRILKLEIPNPNFINDGGESRLSQTTHNLKFEIRKEYSVEIDDYVFDTIIHMTDNYQQNAHISNMLGDLK